MFEQLHFVINYQKLIKCQSERTIFGKVSNKAYSLNPMGKKNNVQNKVKYKARNNVGIRKK